LRTPRKIELALQLFETRGFPDLLALGMGQ
jgi:hypothetical protein